MLIDESKQGFQLNISHHFLDQYAWNVSFNLFIDNDLEL
jgi:hypothetical protein